MGKILVIIEVSKKQDYIFSSKKLRDNIARSNIIRYVTSHEFFSGCAGEYYSEKNMVYSGGGHTILQFDSSNQAKIFASIITKEAMQRYDGLELFVKQKEYDPMHTPGENLKALSAALERKKALRANGFQRLTFGVDLQRELYSDFCVGDLLPAPEGWCFPRVFSDLAGNHNFLAVVHIDGNAMGERVQNIYDSSIESWEVCCQRLRSFSEGIQQDFDRAFLEMLDELLEHADELNFTAPLLPVRPVILAGDDVCFVVRGDLGLECARLFIEKLTTHRNQEDGLAYAACAGISIVHEKFPFHRAYDLSEELCSSAKRFSAEFDRRISAMDWHIEFGQLKNSLHELREDYETEDGQRMELRPLAVVVPEEVCATPELKIRSYGFFRQMCINIAGDAQNIPRRKIKDLRNAIKQGVVETDYFLEDKEISQMTMHGFTAEYPSQQQQMNQYREWLSGKHRETNRAFMHFGSVQRCLFFDAIEILDHYAVFKEAEL